MPPPGHLAPGAGCPRGRALCQHKGRMLQPLSRQVQEFASPGWLGLGGHRAGARLCEAGREGSKSLGLHWFCCETRSSPGLSMGPAAPCWDWARPVPSPPGCLPSRPGGGPRNSPASAWWGAVAAAPPGGQVRAVLLQELCDGVICVRGGSPLPPHPLGILASLWGPHSPHEPRDRTPEPSQSAGWYLCPRPCWAQQGTAWASPCPSWLQSGILGRTGKRALLPCLPSPRGSELAGVGEWPPSP